MGVVSGFVFGVYLYDIKNPHELVFIEGPSLSILTDKTVYKQGDDTVQISIVNTGTVPLVFSDSSFGFKITGLAGFVIYGASDNSSDSITTADTVSSTDILDTDAQNSPGMGAENPMPTLEPGQQVTFTWDLLKTDNTPVLAGVYKLHTLTADSPPITASITVTVV